MNRAYLNKTKEELINLFILEYSKDKMPIQVNFRDLVPQFTSSDRYTHLIHSYPAKLLPQIPFFFLETNYFCPESGIVLDPFCGTGTVLLEAILAKKNAYGADANPLARLITEAKTKYINPTKLAHTLKKILNTAKDNHTYIYPPVGNIDFWFPQKTKSQLASIIKSIQEIKIHSERIFFEACFSNLVKKVSYADPRISVPVKLNPNRFAETPSIYNKIKDKIDSLNNQDVFLKFEQICTDNIKRVSTLKSLTHNKEITKVISDDARILTNYVGGKSKLKSESVDLVLTSPPYAGAQKYIRSSHLNLSWLSIASPDDIRRLDRMNIGRENYSKGEIKQIKTEIKLVDDFIEHLFSINKKERACIVGNYINEMKCAIDESIRVLKTGGYFIMVIGNNKVCNLEFNTQEYLTEYMQSKGLTLLFKLIDDIKSYGLMTKRNKTADIISLEWVLVFKK